MAPGLTPRKEEVMGGLREGMTNKDIARRLGTTEMAVKVQVKAIMRKLGVRNRTQAAVVAWAGGRPAARVPAGLAG